MRRFGFLLLDGHALMSTAAALEPLRAANLFAGRPLYEITLLALAGDSARSSLGSLFPARPLAATAPEAFDLVFVVAGGAPERVHAPAAAGWLRRANAAGVALGGISGGGVILARAGLLDGRRFTVHWHHFDALARLGGGLAPERRLYVIDRDRYTCAGGTAPADMMQAILARDHGSAFAQKIADWFIQAPPRAGDAPQQGSRVARYGPLPRPVEAALELMESHLADPLALDRLAAHAGLSPRQLQRRFRAALGMSVMEAYRALRLDTARALLLDAPRPVAEIAAMTGFASQAHFAQAYRARFGVAPSAARG